MPPTKLGIGVGLADGAEKFMQGLLQGKQFKLQQTLAKNAPAIQALMDLIKDPNSSYQSKADAMDAIPHLTGVVKKMDIPLSEQVGYRKLLREKVLVDEEKPSTMTQANSVTPGMQQFNQAHPDQPAATPDSTMNVSAGTPAIYANRGDLSPRDIEELRTKRINESQQDAELSRQFKLAQYHSNIQAKALANQGWKSNDTSTYDAENKIWQTEWFNPITKEHYTQNFPKGVVPQKVIEDQIKAGGTGGVSKAYSTLKQSVAVMKGKDIDDPDVETTTADLWKKNFQATIDFKEIGITGKRQSTTGTTPPTPEQVRDDEAKLQTAKIAAQKEVDENDRQAKLATVEKESLDKLKGNFEKGTGAWGVYAQAQKELKALQGDDANAAREDNPQEYARLESNLTAAKNRAEDLEHQYGVAVAKENSYKDATYKAQERFDTVSHGPDKSNSGLDLSKFSKKAKAYIQAHVNMPAFGGDLNKLLNAYKTQFGADLK